MKLYPWTEYVLASDHERILAELKPRYDFGDQCWQDRCENAYVEQSVVKRLEETIAEQKRVNGFFDPVISHWNEETDDYDYDYEG